MKQVHIFPYRQNGHPVARRVFKPWIMLSLRRWSAVYNIIILDHIITAPACANIKSVSEKLAKIYR